MNEWNLSISVDEEVSARMALVGTVRWLEEIGLLWQNWGEMSVRLDETHFAITPAGARFEDLTPEELVVVRTDGRYTARAYQPPADMSIHAAVYAMRPDAGAVILTHQVYASCAGVLGRKRLRIDEEGEHFYIPVVPYVHFGEAKTAENIRTAIRRFSDGRSFLLAGHGAMCYGKDGTDALRWAQWLEVICESYLSGICRTNLVHGIIEGYSSRLEHGEIMFSRSDMPERLRRIHEHIYHRRKDVRVILHCKSDAVLLTSRRARVLKPLLDDFAQCIGQRVDIPSNMRGFDGEMLFVKPDVDVVFLRDEGALCLGASVDEAAQIARILDKGCIAQVAVMRFGEGQYLKKKDCKRLYKNYSKS